MTRYISEETVVRRPDHVWTYAADIARHPEWKAVEGVPFDLEVVPSVAPARP